MQLITQLKLYKIRSNCKKNIYPYGLNNPYVNSWQHVVQMSAHQYQLNYQIVRCVNHSSTTVITNKQQFMRIFTRFKIQISLYLKYKCKKHVQH